MLKRTYNKKVVSKEIKGRTYNKKAGPVVPKVVNPKMEAPPPTRTRRTRKSE